METCSWGGHKKRAEDSPGMTRRRTTGAPSRRELREGQGLEGNMSRNSEEARRLEDQVNAARAPLVTSAQAVWVECETGDRSQRGDESVVVYFW